MKMRIILCQCAFLLLAVVGGSCKKEKDTGGYPTPPPAQPVLLKEVNISNLPSPYYRFEYSKIGQLTYASFAAGHRIYDISYNDKRMSEMRSNRAQNKDKLQYSYNAAGKADTINYADFTGIVYKRVCFNYEEKKLIKAVWERKTGDNFISEKAMIFLYYPDENLSELREQRYNIYGQLESTYIDRFEQYDDKMNADGFSLLHNDFFEHLFLLPGVHLQKNNPTKITRTGDGINYEIDYAYTYNAANLPLTKTGEVIFTSGPNAGKRLQTNTNFSYY